MGKLSPRLRDKFPPPTETRNIPFPVHCLRLHQTPFTQRPSVRGDLLVKPGDDSIGPLEALSELEASPISG